MMKHLCHIFLPVAVYIRYSICYGQFEDSGLCGMFIGNGTLFSFVNTATIFLLLHLLINDHTFRFPNNAATSAIFLSLLSSTLLVGKIASYNTASCKKKDSKADQNSYMWMTTMYEDCSCLPRILFNQFRGLNISQIVFWSVMLVQAKRYRNCFHS